MTEVDTSTEAVERMLAALKEEADMLAILREHGNSTLLATSTVDRTIAAIRMAYAVSGALTAERDALAAERDTERQQREALEAKVRELEYELRQAEGERDGTSPDECRDHDAL